MIRPEDVKVGAEADAEAGGAAGAGVIFQGGRQLLTLRCGALTMVAEQAAEEGLINDGEVVPYGW